MALTNAQVSEARRLIRGGMSKTKVAIHLGCSFATLLYGLDPSYRESANERKRQRIYLGGEEVFAPTEADVAARLAEIPDEDTRTITARLMGDPHPNDKRLAGRSPPGLRFHALQPGGSQVKNA